MAHEQETNSVVAFPKKADWVTDTKDPRLHLRVRTGIWYIRAKRKGKRPLFKSTGERGIQAARNVGARIFAEWMGTRPPVDERTTFGPFAETYLEHLKKTTLRPRTKENAALYIGQLIDEIGDKLLSEINEGFFDEWLAEFRSRTDRTTFLDYAKYLSKVLGHAHRRGIIHRLPRFKNPDPRRRVGRVYSDAELAALFSVSRLRLRLQIRLCYQSFMRKREALFLSQDRVDLETGKLTLRPEDVKTGSRTGEGRTFYLGQEALSDLRLWLQDVRRLHPGSPWVFPGNGDDQKPQWTNRRAWKDAKKKAGVIGRARFHDLRHTALTKALVERKENPLMVSKYAGVSMRTIERVYLHVKPEDTRSVGACLSLGVHNGCIQESKNIDVRNLKEYF